MDRAPLLFDFPEPRGTWQKLLPYALLLSVTFALYGVTLGYGFVWDDGPYIQSNYRIQRFTLENLRTIWSAPYLGHYAPLHNTLLALIHLFSGLNPLGYHLANLLLHSASLCLLYQVLKRMESAGAALLTSLLLAVHPTTVETVAWIAETKSTLAFLFFLLSWKFYLEFRESERNRAWILCGVFLALSMLSKINTVVTPLAFLLYEYKEHAEISRRTLTRVASIFAISGTMTVVHLMTFYGPSSNFPEPTYYPGGLPVHLLNLPTLVLFYVRILFFPYPLSGWHLISIFGDFNWVLVGKWFTVLLLGALIVAGNRSVHFWGAWFILFLLPILQIVPFPIWVAERYLYIPAIGLFMLASNACEWALARWRQSASQLALQSAILLVVVMLSWLTWNRLPVWKNDLAFWEATEKTCESAPYCHMSLGNALLRDGQTERGMRELIEAVNLRPNVTNLSALGDAYMKIRDFRQGIAAYQMAWEQLKERSSGDLYARLGRAYLMAGDLGEAERIVRAGLRAVPNSPKLLIVDGFLQWRLGNLGASRQSLLAALQTERLPLDSWGYIVESWGNQRDVENLVAEVIYRSPSNFQSLGEP